MLRDDYEKMMASFKETVDGKAVKLEDLCEASQLFFQSVQDMVQRGSDKEKEEAIAIMSEMYETLMKESKAVAEKSGMTEEQLLAFAENSNNFDKDQWDVLQDARKTMSTAGHTVATYLDDVAKLGVKKAITPKKKKKALKTKRDDWLRS
jgi:hypothetical protein